MIHDEPLELWGFKFPDAPTKWVLEKVDPEFITLGRLLAKFYENLSYDPEPLKWVRDPLTPEGNPYYGDAVIVVLYPRNFYIVIEKQFGELYGPHAARLFYRSYTTKEIFWIAIVQITEMFHSDERLKLSLASELAAKNLYQCNVTAEIIVTR